MENIKLSKNFTLSEFLKSSTASRLGINNTPTQEIVDNLKDLCENVLQPARDHFGAIKINSGYRSAELCEAIGSTSHSNHTLGFAADVETNVPNIELLNWFYDNVEYKELIGEYFGENPSDGWVHIAYQKGNNKGELKIKTKDINYKRVDINELNEICGYTGV